jgi:hypothetical protein
MGLRLIAATKWHAAALERLGIDAEAHRARLAVVPTRVGCDLHCAGLAGRHRVVRERYTQGPAPKPPAPIVPGRAFLVWFAPVTRPWIARAQDPVAGEGQSARQAAPVERGARRRRLRRLAATAAPGRSLRARAGDLRGARGRGPCLRRRYVDHGATAEPEGNDQGEMLQASKHGVSITKHTRALLGAR